MSTPNRAWADGWPRRSGEASMQGRSSWTREAAWIISSAQAAGKAEER